MDEIRQKYSEKFQNPFFDWKWVPLEDTNCPYVFFLSYVFKAFVFGKTEKCGFFLLGFDRHYLELKVELALEDSELLVLLDFYLAQKNSSWYNARSSHKIKTATQLLKEGGDSES